MDSSIIEKPVVEPSNEKIEPSHEILKKLQSSLENAPNKEIIIDSKSQTNMTEKSMNIVGL